MKFLAWLLLLQVNLIAAGFMIAWGGGVIEEATWRHEAIISAHERKVCETKHAQLIKQIKKEGLWQRLGMPGQPWLQ